MTESRTRVDAFRAARERVERRIAAACARVGRDPRTVTLLAVSKTVPADALRDALEAGLGRFGENRVQEAMTKVPDVPGARWTLIGPLQSNKARRALETFESIQSVDSADLARRLDRLVPEVTGDGAYPILLQVNVDLDPAKAGFAPSAIDAALEVTQTLPHLVVGGLMTVGRLTSDQTEARTTFRRLRELSEAARRNWPDLGPALSMGMTDDFEVAVEEGATIVRVGRALFGEREQHLDHEHRHDPAGPTTA